MSPQRKREPVPSFPCLPLGSCTPSSFLYLGRGSRPSYFIYRNGVCTRHSPFVCVRASKELVHPAMLHVNILYVVRIHTDGPCHANLIDRKRCLTVTAASNTNCDKKETKGRWVSLSVIHPSIKSRRRRCYEKRRAVFSLSFTR